MTSASTAAEKVGCTSPTPREVPMLATDAVDCTLNGVETKIFYFSTNSSRDKQIELGGGFGEQYLVFDNFVITGAPDFLATVQESAGGDIQPQ